MTAKLSQNQKTFNKVARHLLKQKKKAVSCFNDCLYRTDTGLRCGIGALIPNRLYNKNMESTNPIGPTLKPILKSLGHDPQFCQDLQFIHDGYEPKVWRSELKRFAKDHKLNMPTV
jgi:hypothetical protein